MMALVSGCDDACTATYVAIEQVSLHPYPVSGSPKKPGIATTPTRHRLRARCVQFTGQLQRLAI